MNVAFNMVSFSQQLAEIGHQQEPAPVHLWDPPYCGEIDLCIKRDGLWWYMGSVISRPALVRLFSCVLKFEQGEYFLVTPAEKIKIQVEDAPFVIIQVTRQSNGILSMTTNVGDSFDVSCEHPLSVEEQDSGQPRPYIEVRAGLKALIGRNIFYELVEMASVKSDGGQESLVLISGEDEFFLGNI